MRIKPVSLDDAGSNYMIRFKKAETQDLLISYLNNGMISIGDLRSLDTEECMKSIVDKVHKYKIRRTVSSYLRTVMTREAVAAMLGHLPETNDKHYDYDISTYSEKIVALEALSSNVINFSKDKKIAEAL